MSSVVQRIGGVKQPRGGYIKPSQFKCILLDDGKVLSDNENIHASKVGMVVDYLSRFMSGDFLEDAFSVSLMGARVAEDFGKKGSVDKANILLSGINGIDPASVSNACSLVSFDKWYRDPSYALSVETFKSSVPKDPVNDDTVSNIQVMVERSLLFLRKYGPVVRSGFTFEPFGYTEMVDTGDGDFLTKDTIWDFKVSKSKLTSKHTLQLLVYWVMGQHSGCSDFDSITRLGVFNPRLNAVYTLDMKQVGSDIIKAVERDIICYD